MLDALKTLFENDVVSEEVRAEIENAWNSKITENRQQVTAELREEFAKLDARIGLAAEIEEAAEDIASLSDETLTWRLKEAALAQRSATLSLQKDSTEYDLAENGARINRDERRAFEALMTQITPAKSS